MQTMLPVGADKIWAEDSAGDGPALVLLHEGVADSRMWDPVWPPLAAASRVIRYDVRGYGRSAAATEPYTLLGDLRAVLSHHDITSAHVVGCSMGGLCALEFALAEPDRVISLVLLCPGIGGYPYPDQPDLDAAYTALEASGDEEGVARLALRQWGAAGDDPLVSELMRSAVRAWPNEEEFQRPGEPTFDRLTGLRPATVIMVGDLDNAGLIASNEAAAQRIPGCRLIRMPGVDHYPTVRAPHAVVETIMNHCAGR